MLNPYFSDRNLKQAMNRVVFLAVLLPSMSVLAATPVESTQDTLQTGSANKQVTAQQSQTPRAHKDDYERHLVAVSQPRNTQMIWLGKNSQAGDSKQSKIIWLGKKKRSD
ncbi:MAG: hypothetical protein HKN57_15190 [Xanthomonadales bacterium]|nr:hypothetical protein [Gammaproteobacteria bacterium]MBT8053633.1 hypothetical protein [Gammaproteobacteria bacterium]NND58589.1 hypothetical protein [Xanthomonadales bacterium]NNK51021.1 hypothetical protein [Xanthomonadales bacterium]